MSEPSGNDKYSSSKLKKKGSLTKNSNEQEIENCWIISSNNFQIGNWVNWHSILHYNVCVMNECNQYLQKVGAQIPPLMIKGAEGCSVKLKQLMQT